MKILTEVGSLMLGSLSIFTPRSKRHVSRQFEISNGCMPSTALLRDRN
jgi:hypothetical protein